MGVAIGYAPLGTYLVGAVAAGVLMAILLAESGAGKDNAKSWSRRAPTVTGARLRIPPP
ncbi:hypothetical protein ACWC09_45355 [Streptomyces sp. NPDC001617]